ncbi:MAG: hypothetical protein ACHREM_04250 [Polyangiales bacterium]
MDADADPICLACSSGRVRPTRGRDRMFPWCGQRRAIPEDIAVPTCDACGAMVLTTPILESIELAFREFDALAAELLASITPVDDEPSALATSGRPRGGGSSDG